MLLSKSIKDIIGNLEMEQRFNTFLLHKVEETLQDYWQIMEKSCVKSVSYLLGKRRGYDNMTLYDIGHLNHQNSIKDNTYEWKTQTFMLFQCSGIRQRCSVIEIWVWDSAVFEIQDCLWAKHMQSGWTLISSLEDPVSCSCWHLTLWAVFFLRINIRSYWKRDVI